MGENSRVRMIFGNVVQPFLYRENPILPLDHTLNTDIRGYLQDEGFASTSHESSASTHYLLKWRCAQTSWSCSFCCKLTAACSFCQGVIVCIRRFVAPQYWPWFLLSPSVRRAISSCLAATFPVERTMNRADSFFTISRAPNFMCDSATFLLSYRWCTRDRQRPNLGHLHGSDVLRDKALASTVSSWQFSLDGNPGHKDEFWWMISSYSPETTTTSRQKHHNPTKVLQLCFTHPCKFNIQYTQRATSWWFQPIWKLLVKLGIFPR